MNCESNCQPPKTLGQCTYERYNEAKGGLTWDGKPIPSWDENKDENVKAAWEEAAKFAYNFGAENGNPERKPSLVDAYHTEPNIASIEMIWEDVMAAASKLPAVLGNKDGIAERTLALRHLEDAGFRLERAINEMRYVYGLRNSIGKSY